jgi:hypothetical protein
LTYWHVVAEDKRGAQWAFLVQSVHQPAAIDVANLFRRLDRVTEITGKFVEIQSLDLGSVQIAGNQAAVQRIHGRALRYSIEGVQV